MDESVTTPDHVYGFGNHSEVSDVETGKRIHIKVFPLENFLFFFFFFFFNFI